MAQEWSVRPAGSSFLTQGAGWDRPEPQFLETYHLRPKTASFNYLPSREQESLLSAQQQLIIAAASCLGAARPQDYSLGCLLISGFPRGFFTFPSFH